MYCETCGEQLLDSTRSCTNCGSRHVQFTLAPRNVLEIGIVSSLVFGLAAISCLLVGLVVDMNAVWLGANIRGLFVSVSVVLGLALVSALFISSLAALRMLERVRNRANTLHASEQTSYTTSELPDGQSVLVEGSALQGWDTFEAPASITEHTTIRLVVSAPDTEKVPRHR